MPKDMMLIFLIAFCLFMMQSIGGYFQIKDYKKAVRRMHKLGNVGIGQTKGGFLSGNLVLIACDSKGMITGAEVLEGKTFLTHFKPKESFRGKTLTGSSIYDFLDEFKSFERKEYKRNKGYIQAMEALDMRLQEEKKPKAAVREVFE